MHVAEANPKIEVMARRIAGFVREKRGGVSFVEIERLFDESEIRGDYAIGNPRNCVWWAGMSKELVDAISLCLGRGEIAAKPTDILVYLIDGKTMRFSLAKRPPAGGYKEPRWLPVTFDPVTVPHWRRTKVDDIRR